MPEELIIPFISDMNLFISISDIEPAITLGMDSMLVLTGNGENDQHSFVDNKRPKYIMENILAGAKFLNK